MRTSAALPAHTALLSLSDRPETISAKIWKAAHGEATDHLVAIGNQSEIQEWTTQVTLIFLLTPT